MSRAKSKPARTFHDLLQLHLQGLDGTGRIVPSSALDPVNGQPAIHHGGHIVVLQEDHPVCVLDHGTVVMKEIKSEPGCTRR